MLVMTWKWGTKYSDEYVRKLAAGVKRHLQTAHRFLCVTDDPIDGIETTIIKDPGLTLRPGCFARLRTFDEVWQRDIGATERIVCLDLDVVITGTLDPLFDRPESFVILQGANEKNPNPFNGSCWMLRAGAHPEIWDDFTLEAAGKTKFYAFPDDQGWFWDRMPNAAGWPCGPDSGVWSFGKRGWPRNNQLPAGARMVAFPGYRDPSMFENLDWVKEHWRP